MAVAFSLLGPMPDKPCANSLSSYYPKKRQDSLLGVDKVAMYGPSHHPPSSYIKQPSKPKPISLARNPKVDISSSGTSLADFASSKAKMQLPTPIPSPSGTATPSNGVATPSLDTMASQAPEYARPQAPTPSSTPDRQLALRPTPKPKPVAPEIGGVAREAWTPDMVQQWQKRQREGAYSEHPYLRSHDLAGNWTGEMPERIGDIRTDPQGFGEDFTAWQANNLSPEARKQFATLSEQSGMAPEAIMRAMQAERQMVNKLPMMDNKSFAAAKQMYDKGETQDAPERPEYNATMRNFYELPPEYREDMLRMQQYEQSQSPRHTGTNAPETPGTWLFPPRSEFAHEGWDPENQPKMMEHTKYRGLPQYMQTFADPQSQDLTEYWKAKMESANRPGPKGPHIAPQNYARAYASNLAGRKDQQEFDEATSSPTSLAAQRILGFRRNNPQTGKEVFTTKGIGRNTGGLAGAARDSLLGGLAALPAGAISVLRGDNDYSSMTGRDIMALPNYLWDADVGHSSDVGAKPAGMGEGEAGAGTDIDRGANTTRGLFGDRYDPLSDTYKISDFGGVGRHYADRAEDPSRGGIDRVLSRGMQSTMENSGDVLANLALMKGMGMKPTGMRQGLRQLMQTGAGSQAIPTLIDPMRDYYNSGSGDTVPRLKETVGRGLQGYLQPYIANPAFPMAGQALHETPYLNKYYKGPDAIRLATMGEGGEASTLGTAGEGLATVMEALPELALMRRAYGPGAAAQKYPWLKNLDKAVSPEYAGIAGLSGMKNAPEGQDWQELVQKRYDMPREEFMKWQQSQSRIDEMLGDWRKGIAADPSVLAKTMATAPPEKARALQALSDLAPAERTRKILGQDEPQAPMKAQGYQKFDPNARTTPEGMTSEQADAGQTAAVDAAWTNMPEEQQQQWQQRKADLQQGIFEQYSQMPELSGFSPEQLQQAAEDAATTKRLNEFILANQVQIEAQGQPVSGGQ